MKPHPTALELEEVCHTIYGCLHRRRTNPIGTISACARCGRTRMGWCLNCALADIGPALTAYRLYLARSERARAAKKRKPR